jgi:predicted DNA-binding transcriptional regulator AlpA
MKDLLNGGSEKRRRLGDVKDVAAITKQSTRSVMRNADRGAMPLGYKIGALRRWDLDEIESWIAGGCKPVRVVKGGRA